MKKTEDNVETVSSKIKLLEGEQEKITFTIGGGKIYFFPGIQSRFHFNKYIQMRFSFQETYPEDIFNAKDISR